MDAGVGGENNMCVKKPGGNTPDGECGKNGKPVNTTTTTGGG